MNTAEQERTLFQAMVGDGRPLLQVLGLGLLGSGLFALFLAATGQFLPHDERFLGMTAERLCSLHACRIVHFMIHDRLAFGGALTAIGVLYLWLVAFPLRQGEAWAWWLLLVSGTAGFASFLAYLGYGYLDTWHGVATLGLLPCFILGVAKTRTLVIGHIGILSLLDPGVQESWASWFGIGRVCLLMTAVGMVVGGITILVVGTTCVFVPQDLVYLGLNAEELHALNPRLVPLIAHDRAGFGGAVLCSGTVLFFSVWCSAPSRALWQALALGGGVGFGAAIGAHPAVGYNDAVHLAPALTGATLFLGGMLLTYEPMFRQTDSPPRDRCPLASKGVRS